MANTLFMQFFSLSLFTLFVGYCFGDGFGLKLARRIFWYFSLLAISIYTLNAKSEFDLAFILPIPTLLATIFCSYEKIQSKKKK